MPVIVWIATALVWGTSWAVIRVGLEDLPPLTFAATRTTLAAIVLLLYALVKDADRRPSGGAVAFWLAIGIPQLGLPYAIIFWAEQSISSGLTAMLFAVFPVFTTILAHLLLRNEPLTRRRLGGTVLGVVAVAVLVSAPGVAAPRGALPMLGVLLAAFSAAFAIVLVRRHGRATPTMWLTALQVLSGAGFLVVLAIVFERGAPVRMTGTAVLAILYLALVVTVGCYVGLFWLLKRLDVTIVSMSVVLETTVAVLLGALFLQETLTVANLLGLILVALSIWFVTSGRRVS